MNLKVKLLEDSFLYIIPQRTRFSELFYTKLFTQYPQVKHMFDQTDMRFQQSKLFAALSMTISTLRNPDVLKDSLITLGQNHKRYQVKKEYFEWFGVVLMETLAQCLENKWTPEVANAWEEAFTTIISMMTADQQIVSSGV